jgi:hypothetical protein
MKADMLKKLLQAGALAAEAGSRGSAGNIASKIVNSGLDFSKSGGTKGKSGASKNAKTIKPFDAYSTDLAAGSKLDTKKIYTQKTKNTDMPK